MRPAARQRRILERLRRHRTRLRERGEHHRPRLAREDDGATRRRLLEVATRLFASHGLEGVSVREICSEALANVAAINYHFGDKLGLYTEVVRLAIVSMRRASADSMRGSGTAEEQLARYIHAQVERVLSGPGGTSWVIGLMNREMENPTPALDRVVRDAIRPRAEYVTGLVAQLLQCTRQDERVAAVVASVHGLPLLLMRSPILTRLFPGWRPNARSIGAFSDQVARFTLAGIRGLAARGREERPC